MWDNIPSFALPEPFDIDKFINDRYKDHIIKSTNDVDVKEKLNIDKTVYNSVYNELFEKFANDLKDNKGKSMIVIKRDRETEWFKLAVNAFCMELQRKGYSKYDYKFQSYHVNDLDNYYWGYMLILKIKLKY